MIKWDYLDLFGFLPKLLNDLLFGFVTNLTPVLGQIFLTL